MTKKKKRLLSISLLLTLNCAGMEAKLVETLLYNLTISSKLDTIFLV